MSEGAGVRVWRSRKWWVAGPALLIPPLGLGFGVWSVLAGDGPFMLLVWAYLALSVPSVFWPAGAREVRVGPSGISESNGRRRHHIPWERVAEVRTVTVANGVQRRVLVTTTKVRHDLRAVPRDELDQLVPDRWARPAPADPSEADVPARSWRGVPRSQWIISAATAVGMGAFAAIFLFTPNRTGAGILLLVLAVLALVVGAPLARHRVDVDAEGIRIRRQNGYGFGWVPWSRIDRIETATSLFRGEHLVLHLDDGLTETLEVVPLAEAASLDPRRWRVGESTG